MTTLKLLNGKGNAAEERFTADVIMRGYGNPDELMKLYASAGAKYFMAMGNHHDNCQRVGFGVEDGEVDGEKLDDDHHDQHDEMDEPLMLQPAELVQMLFQ